MLLVSLVAWPEPGPPMWRITAPSACNSGSACSNAAASPPTMIASVPLSAPRGPPLTGASSTARPRCAPCRASRRARLGSDVLMSITSEPSRAPSNTPRSPSIASSTIAGVGRQVIVTSADAAALAGSSASQAPRSPSRATASGRGSNTPTSCPASSSRIAIGAPILPAPTIATRIAVRRRRQTRRPGALRRVSTGARRSRAALPGARASCARPRRHPARGPRRGSRGDRD